MKFKIVTAGLLLTLSATLLTACGSSASSSKDTSSSKRQAETVSESKAKSASKVKAASESKTKASSSAAASSKIVASSSAKASSESQAAASSSAAKASEVHYTSQHLAIICQVFGQDAANMGISTILDSMSNSTIHYFADTASTGHNSLGTGASYEQYQLNGDQLTITHPAAQGTAAWTKTLSLSQSASAIFSAANTTLVNGITSKMVQEN